MSDHPIEGMMSNTMDKIKQMVDVNTIIGDPITCPDGTMIIPVSKGTYGFAAGGSDFPTKKIYLVEEAEPVSPFLQWHFCL